MSVAISPEEVVLHILFVCTGNICRSPIAERLAIAYGARSDIPGLTASSAGTHAVIGHPIQPLAVRVLEKLSGDASDFAARQLTPRIAADADVVLTMTEAHRDDVLGVAPQQLHRTFTLREAARIASDCNVGAIEDLAGCRSRYPAQDQMDIPDPMGRDEAFFEAVGTQICDLLPPLLELCRRG